MKMCKSTDLPQGLLHSNGTSKRIWSSFNITLQLRVLLIFLLPRIATATLGAHSNDHLTLSYKNDLTLKICREIVHLSKNRQFHVVDLRRNPPVTTLVRSLHESSISTVSIRQYGKMSLFFTESKSSDIRFENWIAKIDSVSQSPAFCDSASKSVLLS